MKVSMLMLCCLGVAQVSAVSAESRYSREVIQPERPEQALVALPLDEAVYAVSADHFSDLRLLDQNGIETPYVVQSIAGQKTVTLRSASASQTTSLQKNGEDGIVITVQLAPDAPNADGLSLMTAQHDFEYDIQVQGSHDGAEWQPLVEHALIYDYARYMAIADHEIELPTNYYRQFRIEVARATTTRAAALLEMTRTLRGSEELQRNETVKLQSESLHIDRIEFWHTDSETRAAEEQRFDYGVDAVRISQDSEQKTTQIELDTRRQPLTGLSVNAGQASFSRHARVEVPERQGVETRWRMIAGGTLEALHFQDIQRESIQLSFPEQRQPHYRIVIENQDSPPLAVAGVTGSGPGYQLVFLSQTGQRYQLIYGGKPGDLPHYDVAPIRLLQQQGYPLTQASLGPEVVSDSAQAAFDFAGLMNSDGFLGSAIGLMVLVLGWSLYRVSKRIGDV